MTTPNTQSLGPSWVYEGTTGTASLVAGDTSYLFGLPAPDDKNPVAAAPTLQMGIDATRAYSTRFPTALTRKWGGTLKWQYKYVATNPQHAYRMLSTTASGAPNGLSAKDTGQKKALTIHMESKGGTNVRRWNACGALSTAMRISIQREQPYVVEEQFDYWKLEDQGETNCPALTSAPIFAETASINSAPYHGINTITLSTASLVNVHRVDITLGQQIATMPTSVKAQKVYVGDMAVPEVAVHGVWMDNVLWDELFDGTATSDLVVKSYQAGSTANYIQWTLYNCMWINESAPVPISGDEGLVYSIAMCQAACASVQFVWGATASDFGTYFPT